MPEIPFAFQCSIAENELLPLKDSVNGFLYSTFISNIPEFEYYFTFYPNGHKDGCRGHMWIFLHLKFKDDVKKVEAHYTLMIESANFSKANHDIYEEAKGRGPPLCKTEEFFDPERKFIVDGKFIVKINGFFKFETGNAIPAGIEQKWIGGELGDESWAKDDSKDFTIATADGNEIKVHKLILGIRSEVFAAMLKSNMTEAAENKVNVTDFSFKVVETGIKLIYECNFITSLSLDDLMSLLQFFDKYQLLSLKDKIEPLLVDQIAPSTVVRLTNCSVQTNSFKLKEKCIEFLMVAFQSKTPLTDIQILDKDIALKILENSFYQHLDIIKK